MSARKRSEIERDQVISDLAREANMSVFDGPLEYTLPHRKFVFIQPSTRKNYHILQISLLQNAPDIPRQRDHVATVSGGPRARQFLLPSAEAPV
jgi:hypothetical protein